MRDYRAELTGETLTFVTYFSDINEYEAKEQAKKAYPDFTITKFTEILPRLEDDNV